MPSLQVLQLRNSPIAISQGVFPLRLIHVTKAFANDFLEEVLWTSDETGEWMDMIPELKALIIGTQSYRQHWQLQHESHTNHLAPHLRADEVADRPMVFGITSNFGPFRGLVVGLEQFEFRSLHDLDEFIPVNFMNSVWLLNSVHQTSVRLG